MTNSEMFRKAADYIRKHGWVQGRLGDGPKCAIGAIYAVANVPSATPAQYAFVTDWGDKHGRTYFHDILGTGLAQWNDQPDRTKKEVIALFDSLADDWALKEQIAAFDEDLKAAAKQASELNDVEPSPSLLKEAVPV